MLDRRRLKAEFVRNGLTQAEVAQKIGMDPSTFARKMKKSGFYTEEAKKMIDLLKIQTPDDIFFADEVT